MLIYNEVSLFSETNILSHVIIKGTGGRGKKNYLRDPFPLRQQEYCSKTHGNQSIRRLSGKLLPFHISNQKSVVNCRTNARDSR